MRRKFSRKRKRPKRSKEKSLTKSLVVKLLLRIAMPSPLLHCKYLEDLSMMFVDTKSRSNILEPITHVYIYSYFAVFF